MSVELHKIVMGVKGKISIGLDPLTGKGVKFVYQRVRKGLGNIPTRGRMDLQFRIEPPRIDKKSATQLQGRARITAAVAQWQGMTVAEKDVFRQRAKRLCMSGYNLSIRDYCSAHPLSEF
jgi:hypothetical protein